ncbi:Nuclear pore complex protein Nup98-Nup96, partial [Homalodisca vitripennis]
MLGKTRKYNKATHSTDTSARKYKNAAHQLNGRRVTLSTRSLDFDLCLRMGDGEGYKEAAEFLLKAEQWNEAHKVIIQHISAKAIINEKHEYLGGLLKQLAPHSKVISNWGQQGALLMDYLSVVQQVARLVTQRDPSVGYQLERLQPQLTSLCGRIHLLPVPSALH